MQFPRLDPGVGVSRSQVGERRWSRKRWVEFRAQKVRSQLKDVVFIAFESLVFIAFESLEAGD